MVMPATMPVPLTVNVCVAELAPAKLIPINAIIKMAEIISLFMLVRFIWLYESERKMFQRKQTKFLPQKKVIFLQKFVIQYKIYKQKGENWEKK